MSAHVSDLSDSSDPQHHPTETKPTNEPPGQDEPTETPPPQFIEITAVDFEKSASWLDLSGYRPYRQSLLTLVVTHLVPGARASDLVLASPRGYKGLRACVLGRYFELRIDATIPAGSNDNLDNMLLTWFDKVITQQTIQTTEKSK